MASGRPELDLDLFSESAIRDPHPSYRAIRDRAPAVWLPAHGVWALGRYDDVRAALRADESQLESLLRSMVERVQRIEVGEPVVLLSNLLRGYASFSAALR